MIGEDFIKNAEKLVKDCDNMNCLFRLHVLCEFIITQNWVIVSLQYIQKVPENKIEMNHWLKMIYQNSNHYFFLRQLIL